MEVGALVIAAISGIISITTFYCCWHRDKAQRSINAYQELQPFLFHIYEYGKDEIETFVTNTDSEEYKVLSSCLAQIEIFAAGVRTKLYSFKTIYPLAHGYLDGVLRSQIDSLLEMKNYQNEETGFYSNTIWLLDEMNKQSETAIQSADN